MAKDVKRVWHLPCWLLEPEGLEQKFARMAAQGWLLERCTYWTCTYRRGEPGEYEYRVQYIYESRDGQRSDYVKMLGEMGIEKAGDIGSFLVMKKRADGTPFELYSVLVAQIRDTRRLMWINIIVTAVLVLLAANWFYQAWDWYDLAVSFDAFYAELIEKYNQPKFLSWQRWAKYIVNNAALGVLGTAAALRMAAQAVRTTKRLRKLRAERMIQE